MRKHSRFSLGGTAGGVSLNPENVEIVFYCSSFSRIALASASDATSKTGRGRVSQAWWAKGECAGHSLGRLDLRQRTVVSSACSVVENLPENSGQFDTMQPLDCRHRTNRLHTKVGSTVKYLL